MVIHTAAEQHAAHEMQGWSELEPHDAYKDANRSDKPSDGRALSSSAVHMVIEGHSSACRRAEHSGNAPKENPALDVSASANNMACTPSKILAEA